jgi:hypothetical protein
MKRPMIMTRFLSVLALAVAWPVVSCGPEAPDEPEAPGALEYDAPDMRLYRLGRRVDAFYVGYMGVEQHECGMMSERARDELEGIFSALDPEADYGCDPETRDCTPETRIHIEGFEHSPFACDIPVTIVNFEDPPYVCEFVCCVPGLARAALIYWLIGMYFGGAKDPFVFGGEPYVAIEPDEPCPPLEGWGP